MNNTFIKNIAAKFNLSLLSKIALIITSCICIISLFGYYSVVDYKAKELMYEFIFTFPRLGEIFSLMTRLVPYILLVLFFNKHIVSSKVPAIFCTVFCICSLNWVFTALTYSYSLVIFIVKLLFALLFAAMAFSSIYFKKYINKADVSIIVSAVFIMLTFSFIETSSLYLPHISYCITEFNVISCFLMVVVFVLATISVLKGLHKKIYVILALSIGIILKFVNLVGYLFSIGDLIKGGMYLYILTNPLGIIAEGILYLTLLVFFRNNKTPNVFQNTFKKEKISTPEQELRALKERLEIGVIGEEEYQVQRAEIISKL